MKLLASLFSGLLFGAGLVISGMANPEKVLAFLTLAPGWDPALMFVMGAALAVNATGYWLVRRRGAPLLDADFHLPISAIIDAKLVGGAVIFGLGWGLAGYCPGPAIAGAALLDPRAVVFMAAFLVGLFAFEFTLNRPKVSATSPRP